ncbi:nucleotide exchange factor GrpE [Bradyrhizobium pachyrhizi]|uniref:nucleotide exchange factor GrpE n=1 Tax=Bradyrhizobium pachyrhizi TaxID=280333 RepID=UPI000A6887CC|nr:nucleotide exchange factor GrpE [Bradyrhizobium pachyrhizi]
MPEGSARETTSGSPDAADTPPSAAEDVHEAIARLVAENVDLKDRLFRALADAENVRRRSERELNDMRQYAVTKFAGDMVNVADNLERAMSSLPAELRDSAGPFKTFVEGVELTEKELLRSLEAHGVKRLDPAGSRFDPHFHEAMFQVKDPSVPKRHRHDGRAARLRDRIAFVEVRESRRRELKCPLASGRAARWPRWL